MWTGGARRSYPGRMKRVVDFSLDGTDSVSIEVEEQSASGVVKTGALPELPAEASFGAAMNKLQRLSRVVLESLKTVGPSDVSVEMGIRLDSKAGIVLAQAASGVHLTVRLTWKAG